jgi:glycosyltransferase 2 family protein
MLCVLRSLAAFVPAAIGVQEAGYAMLAPLFGLPAELGLAVSLLKRAREIVLGVPSLLYWQSLESRKALASKLGAADG